MEDHQNQEDPDDNYEIMERVWVNVTPHMVVSTVKRLYDLSGRLLITSMQVMQELRRKFPVNRDIDALHSEVRTKLKVAKDLGLVIRQARAYRPSNAREKGILSKSDVSAFWERYDRIKNKKPRPGSSDSE